MIIYKRIFLDPAFACSHSDMVELKWKKGGIDA